LPGLPESSDHVTIVRFVLSNHNTSSYLGIVMARFVLEWLQRVPYDFLLSATPRALEEAQITGLVTRRRITTCWQTRQTPLASVCVMGGVVCNV